MVENGHIFLTHDLVTRSRIRLILGINNPHIIKNQGQTFNVFCNNLQGVFLSQNKKHGHQVMKDTGA